MYTFSYTGEQSRSLQKWWQYKAQQYVDDQQFIYVNLPLNARISNNFLFSTSARLLTKPSLCHSILNEMNTTLDLWYDLESNYLHTSQSIMLIMFRAQQFISSGPDSDTKQGET